MRICEIEKDGNMLIEDIWSEVLKINLPIDVQDISFVLNRQEDINKVLYLKCYSDKEGNKVDLHYKENPPLVYCSAYTVKEFIFVLRKLKTLNVVIAILKRNNIKVTPVNIVKFCLLHEIGHLHINRQNDIKTLETLLEDQWKKQLNFFEKLKQKIRFEVFYRTLPVEKLADEFAIKYLT